MLVLTFLLNAVFADVIELPRGIKSDRMVEFVMRAIPDSHLKFTDEGVALDGKVTLDLGLLTYKQMTVAWRTLSGHVPFENTTVDLTNLRFYPEPETLRGLLQEIAVDHPRLKCAEIVTELDAVIGARAR